MLIATGCSLDASTTVNLGNVPIGTQIAELQAAQDAGALTAAEFEEAKARLLASLEPLGESAD
ncbi:MAG: SHOCT domain-containing protein [Pseudomonadota bacterium]